MRFLIQTILIAAVVVIVYRLITVRGARSQALRRLGMIVFGVLAISSIILPGMWTAIARAVGVGRGADLLLYALVIAFLGYVVNSYLRLRDMETRFTKLARRIALDEAVTRYPEFSDSSAKLGTRLPINPPSDEGPCPRDQLA